MVRKCIDFYYANNSGGLPGNDDCGTTSSWLLFSAMGFYPACPSTTQYQIGCPLFEKISIKLNPDFYKGDKFQIEARNASNVYIQGMSLNGQEYKKYSLDHKDITSGGSWTVTLGEKPKMK